jgi:lipoprotein signal peptidase
MIHLPSLVAPQRSASGRVASRSGSQGLVAFGLLTTIALLDQLTKFWAWRHVPDAVINSGATGPLGSTVSSWYSGPVTGALLDMLDCGLLTMTGIALLRRPRSVLVLLAGTLMIGGWGSNLLDRLGLHRVTAPGSIRGAVDFIHLGPDYWNLADFVVAAATCLVVVAVALSAGSRKRGAVSSATSPRQHRRMQAAGRRGRPAVAVGVLVAVALIVDVAIGAANAGGVVSRSANAASAVHLRRAGVLSAVG